MNVARYSPWLRNRTGGAGKRKIKSVKEDRHRGERTLHTAVGESCTTMNIHAIIRFVTLISSEMLSVL